MQQTQAALYGRPDLADVVGALKVSVGATNVDTSRYGRDDGLSGTIVFTDWNGLEFRLFMNRWTDETLLGPDFTYLSLARTDRGQEILRKITAAFGGRFRPIEQEDDDIGWESVPFPDDTDPVLVELAALDDRLSPRERDALRSILSDPEKRDAVIEAIERLSASTPRPA